MKAKSVIAAALLVFVGVSVAWLIIQESSPESAARGKGGPGTLASSEADAPGDVEAAPVAPDGQTGHKLIAYYFHRTKRCRTCLTIEAYAREALKDAFPQAMSAGELEWRTVNVEEPAHEHFVEYFQLAAGALVLVDTQDGVRQEWRNLARVWELVGDERKFKSYVEAETMAVLEPDL